MVSAPEPLVCLVVTSMVAANEHFGSAPSSDPMVLAGVRAVAGGAPAGFLPLRQAIADYLRLLRGVRCEAEQVIIISGTRQGLDLAARLLLAPGDTVWLEDPGYLGLRGPLAAAGARLVPVPVDEEGIDLSRAELVARLPYVPGSSAPSAAVWS